MPASATATFLFCDLVGSTALLTRIGDDAGDEVRRRCFGVFRQAVHDHRGTEVKTMGDGMLALFPHAVGDGIGCSIAMQRGITRLNHESPLLQLGLRVGVAVGDAVGEEGDWFGTPVVEAARLCGVARRGQILVADLARLLVGTRGSHRFTSLGAMELKGLDPVLVSEVAWEPEPGQSVVPLPADLDLRGQPLFVGRPNERAALDAAWRRAEGGRFGAVIVTGEQGIGKTRLVAEAARSIHASGATVLYGRCRPDTHDLYEPVAEALSWYVAAAPADELRAQLGSLGDELVRLVPSLLTRFADLPRPAAASTGARRRLFDAVEGFITAAASASPVLLVLDDLHLAEPPTVALLGELVRGSVGARLLLVAIATDVPDHPGPLEEIGSRPNIDVVTLGGLTDADVVLLTSTVSGRPPSDVAGEAATLRAETDGNPSLVSELLAQIDGTGAPVLSLPCPYKGLAAFQPEDHEVFFGREEVIAGLLARLASAPLLAVVGASGSGKSSVVRAGLLPGVWRGALPGSGAWRTVVMAPGSNPLAELAAQVALLLHQGPAALLHELETDRRALNLAVRQLLVGANPAARLLLVIDQFEELFTICEDAAEREQFLDALLYAVGAPGARTSAVVVLRADFYGYAADVPALAAALENNHALIGPMREDELRAAVERPARHVGLRLEPGLTDAIVADVVDQPGGLPLLSHALLETWKERSGRTLTIAAYRAVGGARGALARSADSVLAGMDSNDQAITHDVFLRLVEVGDGTDDTSRRAELHELNTGDDPKVAAVLQRLIDARLLTAGESTVEIAHEALIRGWPRLRDWLDEDREGLRLLSYLRTSAHEWDRLGRDPGELQRGARLAATIDWVDETHLALDNVERDYLAAGRAAEEAELEAARDRAQRDARAKRRLRTLLAATAILLVAVLVAGLLVVRQRNRADASGTLAEARRLGTQALVVDGYDRALLLAVEGRHLDDSPETRTNLLSTIQRSPDAVGVIRSTTTGFLDLAVTADGMTLLASGGRGTDAGLSAYDVATRQQRGLLRLPTNPLVRAAVSPDGRIAVVSDVSGYDPAGERQYQLLVVDPATLTPAGQPLTALTGVEMTRLVISPDNRLVAGVTDIALTGETTPPAEALVWDVTKGGGPVLRYPFEAETRQRDVAFLPDSKTVLVAGNDGTSLVEIATGQEIRRIDGAFAPIALIADGSTLAATLDPATADTIGLFDVATGQRRKTLGSHRDRIGHLAFSPDGTTLASGGDDRVVTVWDVATGQRRAVFEGHTAAVEGLAFSPDSATLYSSSLDRTIYVWDLRRSATLVEQIPPGVHGSPQLAFRAEDMQLSPDAARVEFTSDDFTPFQFQEVATGELSAPSNPDDGVFTMFAPDGRRIVTMFKDTTTNIQHAQSIRLFDRLTGALVASTNADAVWGAAAFTPDGRRLVYIGADDSLSHYHLGVLDTATLDHIGSLMALDIGLPTNVAVMPDGHRVVVVSYAPPNVDVIDLDQRRVVRSTAVTGIQAAWSSALAPGGRTVGIGSPDGRMAIVDIATGTETPAVEAHDGPVQRVSFAPDVATLVSSGRDGTVKLWDTETLQLLGSVQPLGAKRLVQAWFIGPGLVLIAYSTGEMFEWDTRGDAWEAHACAVAGRNLTKKEWAGLFPARAYRSTCPQYPPGG